MHDRLRRSPRSIRSKETASHSECHRSYVSRPGNQQAGASSCGGVRGAEDVDDLEKPRCFVCERGSLGHGKDSHSAAIASGRVPVDSSGGYGNDLANADAYESGGISDKDAATVASGVSLSYGIVEAEGAITGDMDAATVFRCDVVLNGGAFKHANESAVLDGNAAAALSGDAIADLGSPNRDGCSDVWPVFEVSRDVISTCQDPAPVKRAGAADKRTVGNVDT